MLVSHPNTVSAIAATVEVGGVFVEVGVGVKAVAVGVTDANGVTLGVSVLMIGVEVKDATPITTGVAVKTNGGCVTGRNGVGGSPGRGWMIQPLHDVRNSASRMKGVTRFICSPLPHCIAVDALRIVPRL